MTYSELFEKLVAAGLRHAKQDGVVHQWTDPSNGTSITIIDRGSDEVSMQELLAVMTQFSLSERELAEL